MTDYLVPLGPAGDRPSRNEACADSVELGDCPPTRRADGRCTACPIRGLLR